MTWECGMDLSGSGQSPLIACCKHGNETSDYSKARDLLNNFYLVTKKSPVKAAVLVPAS